MLLEGYYEKDYLPCNGIGDINLGSIPRHHAYHSRDTVTDFISVSIFYIIHRSHLR